MELIPVLDLMGGQVVAGRRGERARYGPLRSVLTPSTCPVEVARALQAALGPTPLYLADLDAIMGLGGHARQIRRIAEETGARILLDAGIRTARDLTACPLEACAALVLGTETLASLEALGEIADQLGPERLILSLDARQGQPLTASPELDLPPAEAARRILPLGVQRFLLLDLWQVGSSEGLGAERLAAARALRSLGAEVLIGGGVSRPEDLARAREAGVSGVLVSRALHEGALTRGQLLPYLGEGPSPGAGPGQG